MRPYDLGLAMCPRAITTLVFLLIATLEPLAGQTEEVAGTLQITLSTSMGFVGDEVRFPLYLEGEAADETQSLSLNIRFPANLLKFNRVEEGFLLQGSRTDLESRIQVGEREGDSSTLILNLRARSTDGIPEGLLMYLHFHIEYSTPLGSEISIENEAQATLLRNGITVEIPAAFPDGKIAVSPREKENRILFGCFFYMH